MSPEEIRKHKGVSFVGVTASFFCHDGSGSFYLARRSENARDEQGTWDPGGGGLKIGETVEAAVRREVKEEYGADACSIEFLGYDDAFRKLKDGTPTHWLAMRFAVLVDPAEVSICEPEALVEGGWFTLDTLPTPLHSMFPKFLKKYQKQLKKILGS